MPYFERLTGPKLEETRREIERPKAPRCPFEHNWEFLLTARGEAGEAAVRQAIKHMVTMCHKSGNYESGGYKIDISLYQTLTLGWFRRAGLLRTLVSKFKGDPELAIDFTWPEGFPLAEKDPTKIRFWQEFQRDLELVDVKTMTLGKFLHSFDPEKNRGAYPGIRGKYREAGESFSARSNGHSEQNLANFLTTDFIPPANEPEFVEVVNKARLLIGERLIDSFSFKNRVEKRLEDPHFWAELSKDINSFSQNSRFNHFMQFFNPNNPAIIDAQSIRNWSMRGKYDDIHFYLRSFLYPSYLKEQQAAGNTNISVMPASRVVRELFWSKAPADIKLLLIAKFPKDFKNLAVEAINELQLVPEEIRPILNGLWMLADDSRALVIKPLVDYTRAKHGVEGHSIPADHPLESLFNQAIIQLRHEAKTGKPEIKTVWDNLRALYPLLRDTESNNILLAQTSKRLLDALNRAYFVPFFRSSLYKDASLFWSYSLTETPGLRTVQRSDLIEFLKNSAQEKISSSSLENAEAILEYLQSEILPSVYEKFAESADFASQIKYFKDKDRDGKDKHLFFHQVEAIKYLIEWHGGILGDEPGTGKTVELALAALNLLDKKDISQERPGRVLVVGTKSVIDNWEIELKRHINSDDIDLVNVNYAYSPDGNKFSEEQRVYTRLLSLRRILESSRHNKQLILINYDLFRHPDFKKLLAEHKFDGVVVDEAHNVKSRFREAIDPKGVIQNKKVAKRTLGLYNYIIDNHPQAFVFFATSTPYVKALIEPLIMGHLVKPDILTMEKVLELEEDVVGTYQALRSVMLRRRKEEILDLPPKETILIPIDLNSLTEEQKVKFHILAQQIDEHTSNEFARFYSLLSLEAQAKLPWLIDKVKQIHSGGKKVLIFTPFVEGDDRYTAPISTTSIAQKLREAGISRVGVLDGSLTDEERLITQADFLSKDGIQALVGNYVTAGESITLNSPENRATEVILFIAPNAIHRYIQAIDRVHRIGQTEKVTIHIPYATSNLLGRKEGTYDERIVKRLINELAFYAAVVDGLFFVEAEDIYQNIVKKESVKLKGQVDFKVTTPNEGTRKKSPRMHQGKDETDRYRDGLDFKIDLNDPDSIDAGLESGTRYGKPTQPTEQERVVEGVYFSEIADHPFLSFAQERRLFNLLQKGDHDIQTIIRDPQFFAASNPGHKERLETLAKRCSSIQDLIARCNQRLVLSVAREYQGRGVPLMDLVQEGNTGLMEGIKRFEPELETRFTTYTTWWIRQRVRRAIQDFSLPIRLPVHVHEDISKIRRLAGEFKTTHGRSPNKEEWQRLLSGNGLSEDDLNKAIYALSMTRVTSLDGFINDDKDIRLEELMADKQRDTAGETEDKIRESELREQIQDSFNQHLSKKEKRVLMLRFGLEDGNPRTLEDIGQELHVSRERIRQIQNKAFGKLKRDEKLRRRWEEDAPSFIYRMSAEDAAFRLGVFGPQSGPKEEKAKRKEAQHPIAQVANIGLERKTLSYSPSRARKLVEKAMQKENVWSTIPLRARTILRIVTQNGTNNRLVGEQHAIIFRIPQEEIEKTITESLKAIEVALRAPHNNGVEKETSVSPEQVRHLWKNMVSS